jgi:hypothetical protein
MSFDGMAPASVNTSAEKKAQMVATPIKESLAESRPSPKAAKNRPIKVFYDPLPLLRLTIFPRACKVNGNHGLAPKLAPYDDLTKRDRMPTANVAACQIASFLWALAVCLPQAVPPKILSWRRGCFCTSGCKNPGTGDAWLI